MELFFENSVVTNRKLCTPLYENEQKRQEKHLMETTSFSYPFFFLSLYLFLPSARERLYFQKKYEFTKFVCRFKNKISTKNQHEFKDNYYFAFFILKRNEQVLVGLIKLVLSHLVKVEVLITFRLLLADVSSQITKDLPRTGF